MAVLAVTVLAATVVPAQAADLPGEVAARLAELVQAAGDMLSTAHARAPALVMVLAALFVVPVSAVSALLVHGLWLRLGGGRRRRSRPVAAVPAGEGASAGLEQPVTAGSTRPRTRSFVPWPRAAWLSLEGAQRAPLPRGAGVVRIGRHEENDIRLPHTSVHRHHAVIHRTPEAEFIITDLSGNGGNGVVINGERLSQARLIDGDVIALGEVRMRFESAPL